MSPRVLLVDDEEQIRHAVTRLLQRLGYDVVCAADGDSAYALLWDEAIDVVLIDIHLPRLRGDALALAILHSWPHLRGRLVLMSGDVEATRPDWPTALHECLVLGKPFRLDELSAVIADALAETPRRRSTGHA